MRRLLLPAALLAVAGCHSGASVNATNASAAQVEQRVAAAGEAASLSPGRWEGTMAVHQMQMSGVDPKVAAMMQQRLSRPQRIVSCLTPEQARSPQFFGKDDHDCRYDHFTMSGGAIDAVASCTGSYGQRTIKVKGTYSADSYHVDTAATTTGAHSLSMNMTMDARRTGACTGREDQE